MMFRHDEFASRLDGLPASTRTDLGITPEILDQLAAGSIRPSINLLTRIVKALGCPAEALLGPGPDDRPTELGPGTDAWIKRMVEQLPPMTPEQARRTSVVLFGGGRE